MSEDGPVHDWDTPRIEVRVYRHGDLVQRELCDSEDEATQIVETWAEFDDVTCEVDDLAVRHRPGDVLEPEPAVSLDEDHPREAETPFG